MISDNLIWQAVKWLKVARECLQNVRNEKPYLKSMAVHVVGNRGTERNTLILVYSILVAYLWWLATYLLKYVLSSGDDDIYPRQPVYGTLV